MESLLEFNLNPFQIFDIDLYFNINVQELDKKYFNLQKNNHPDYKNLANKNSNSSEVDNSFLKIEHINSSYKILKDPLSRLKALVISKGGSLNKRLSFDFLEACLEGSFDFCLEYEKRIETLMANKELSLNDLEKICQELIYIKRKT